MVFVSCDLEGVFTPVVREILHPGLDHVIGPVGVVLHKFGLVVAGEELAQQADPMVQGLDGVVIPLVDADGHGGEARAAELISQLGAGGVVEHNVRLQLHELLYIDLGAVDEAGLHVQDLRVQLAQQAVLGGGEAQQAVLRGGEAGLGHTHDLACGVEEHRQHTGQGQDITYDDAVDLVGDLHLDVVVVDDDVGVGACLGLGRATRTGAEQQTEGQNQTEQLYSILFHFIQPLS